MSLLFEGSNVDPALRTPAVEAALAAVRCSGGSAFPCTGELVSAIAFAVAVQLDQNPVEVQREIGRYADASNALARESLARCRAERHASVMDADG